ncbi:MAG: hypothetical protein M9894_12065 [Planctomycetes bacterium]|nr:hypothetical protein [Planctomycetota bacterium]
MADDARETDTPDAGAAPSAQPADDAKGVDGPAEPALVAATAADEGAAPAHVDATDGEAQARLDPQLIGLAVVLWLLAVGIFVFKWDRLRVDWYLGNIKETGDLAGRLDDTSMQALADLAKDDPGVLRMVADEVLGPLANRDEFYRTAIVKTIERVPGPAALDLLVAAAGDYHGVVRANTYVSLGARAKADPAERPRVVETLIGALGTPGDIEPMGRAYALKVLADLEAREALWPVIREVRGARGAGSAVNREAAEAGERVLRERGAEAFYALAGVTPEQLPFDPQAELAVRDAQVRAWERWFVESGGAIPPGERFEEVFPATDSTQGPPPTEGTDQEPQGSPQ